MNWEAIAAITEIVGILLVIITLVYLAQQIKDSNRQAELEGLRHTLDGFNEWCDLIVQSKDTAAMLIKGRASLESLDAEERLQFDHLHIRFLNTMEGWCRSVEETAREESYRQAQIDNMDEAVFAWFSNPGARVVWDEYREAFPLLKDTFDRALAKLR